jgi:hypothetical protein
MPQTSMTTPALLPSSSSSSSITHTGRDSTSGSDRRTQRRKPLDVFANRFLEGYPYLCRATDISPEGMCLRRLHEPALAPGPRARFMGLQFQLPGSSEVLTASGEVVSHDDTSGTVGVRFTQLAPRTARALRSFLGR